MLIHLNPPPHYDPSVRYRASLAYMRDFLAGVDGGSYQPSLVRQTLVGFLGDLKCIDAIERNDDFICVMSAVVSALAESADTDAQASVEIRNIFQHFYHLINGRELNLSILSLYTNYIHSLNNLGEHDLARVYCLQLLPKVSGCVSEDDFMKYSFELLLQLEAAELMLFDQEFTDASLDLYIEYIHELNNLERFEEVQILCEDLISRIKGLEGEHHIYLTELGLQLETAVGIMSEQKVENIPLQLSTKQIV